MSTKPQSGQTPWGRDTRHAQVRARRAAQAAADTPRQLEGPLEIRDGRQALRPLPRLTALPPDATLGDAVQAYNGLIQALRAWSEGRS